MKIRGTNDSGVYFKMKNWAYAVTENKENLQSYIFYRVCTDNKIVYDC